MAKASGGFVETCARNPAELKGQRLRRQWRLLWRWIRNRFYEGNPYGLHLPSGQRVFTPWFDTSSESDFAQDLATVRSAGHVSMSPDRCYLLYQLARSALTVPGDVAECGVFTGGTAQLLALAVERAGDAPNLHLFDSFVGMPSTAERERDYHIPGEFGNISREAVEARLRPYQFCRFHVGYIPDTFSEVSDVNVYSFVHVDVDIYPSARDCCHWFWPRLASSGILLFDDYGFYPYRKAIRAAVDEFFADKPEPVISLPTGQAFVIKR